MDPKVYQKVEKIFYLVLDERPDDVKAYVLEKAGADTLIVDKVMSLLAIEDYKTYGKTSNKLVENLSGIISDHSGGFESDRYQLLEKIGEGGMGSVYMAHRIDKEVEQKVAIKLINTALTTDANVERFKNERQILASLDHENIARFIDAGTTDTGVLYVVMEYIEGVSLKHYCLQNQLTIKQKFSLFLQLCNAIDYAHKNFIIHRDIKPTNILVNKEGKVKLLDFGIAKLVDEDAQQMIATVTKIMTPAYASPEQLLGKKVTVQSDIYALGIVLFEIIIGCRPYQKYEADSYSYQMKVINGINTKPSHLLDDLADQQKLLTNKQVLKGDIDALLTKVIHPDIKYRYETVYELKGDINNYLAGFPVKARKPNSWHFFRLFVKRNKLITSLSSVSLIIIIGFSVYSYIQNQKLISRGIELAEQRDEAIRQAKKAKLASDFLLDSFQTADPTRTFGEKLTIKKVMEDSYEKLKNDPLEDHSLNAELFHTISKAFYGMDAIELAFEAANKGLLEVEKTNKIEPLVKVKLLIERAKGFSSKNDYQASDEILNNALIICNANKYIEDCLIDEIYFYIARNQNYMGNGTRAKTYLSKSMKWMETKKIGGLRYAMKLLLLATVENNGEAPKEALIGLNRLKQMISLNNPSESYYYLEGRVQTVHALIKQKKIQEADTEVDDLIDQIQIKFGQKNFMYTRALTLKAISYAELGQYDKAIILFQQVIEIKKQLGVNYAFEYNKIGNVYYHKKKDYKQSLSYYSEAVRLDASKNSNTTNESGFFRRNLGFAYYKNNNDKQALKNFKESKNIFENLEDKDNFLDTITGLADWINYLEQKLLEKK